MRRLEESTEIAHAQHPHCAVVPMVDTSISMAGDKILHLNQGLRTSLTSQAVPENLDHLAHDLTEARVNSPTLPAWQGTSERMKVAREAESGFESGHGGGPIDGCEIQAVRMVRVGGSDGL
jgi:hypothetical protein